MVLLNETYSAGLYDFRAQRFRIELDPSTNRLLPEGDPDVAFYEFSRRVFGNDESLLVVVQRCHLGSANGLGTGGSGRSTILTITKRPSML